MAFKDIVGQQKAKRIIQGMLKKDRLPQALLFTGEPGVGKLLMAKTLIKVLNCQNNAGGGEIDCCDNCRPCQLIDNLNFADLLFIKPEGTQIKIETVRGVIDFLSMSPYEARIKSVIIDDADKLNISAANALLKTLEEPSEDSLIILITERPDMLPDTIRSRCVRIPFTPLSEEESSEVIKQMSNIRGQRSEVRGQNLRKNFPQTLTSDIRHLTSVDALSLLIEGRPGLIAEEGFDKYRKAIKQISELLVAKVTVGGEVTVGGVSNSLTNSPPQDREELLMSIDIALIFLRNRLVSYISSGRDDYLQVIIENYKKLSNLKNLMQFNLNQKITWNYIVSILRESYENSKH
jgi:DNA polymerase-3 subunit delta'